MVEQAGERRPVAQRIVDIVRELGLQPGESMPTELELIARLGVSRNTVREAIRELRAWGIVEVRHGHGTYVASPSLRALAPSLVFRTLVAGPEGLDALENLAKVREILECAAVADVAGSVASEDLERLSRLCERIGDPAASAEADREFHRILYQDLSNALIGQLVDVFWDAYHEAHGHLADLSAYGDESVEAHRRIVEAVAEGGAEQAQEAMRAHFAGIYARLELARTEARATAS